MGIFFILWGFKWLIYEGVVGVVACFSIRQTFLDKLLCSNYFGGYYTTTLITPFIPFSIQLYGHQKIIHIIGPTFCVFVRHRVTAPSFSVRKYVYFVHTILTVYLTILYTFIASAQGGAALAPYPPQSTHGLRPLNLILLWFGCGIHRILSPMGSCVL